MKKLLLMMMALVLMVAVFAGCSGKSDALTVAVDDTYPPMEYVDENGELVGFDIELAKALGEEMDVEVEFISTAWDSIFAGLEADKYDCIISSVSMKKDRMQTMDFSTPYLANGQVIVVNPAEEGVSTQADLVGKKVGVQFATTADEAAGKIVDEIGFELIQFDDMTICLAAMEAGQIDCVVADVAVAMGAVEKNPDVFKISSASLTNEPIAIAVNKGNDELLAELEDALAAVQASGKLSEISIKYLGSDLTQDIDTELR